MRKLDFNVFKICQILGIFFEKSVDLSKLNSLMFIRRFMAIDNTKIFFSKTYLSLSSNEEDIIFEINELYASPKNKKTLSKDLMYWVGYIYGALSFLYELPSKSVYKLFPASEIIKYYNIYHTFDIEEAASRMMENIEYSKKDFILEGKKIMKNLIELENLKDLIGSEIKLKIGKNNIIRINKQNENIKSKLTKNLDDKFHNYIILNNDSNKNDGYTGIVLAILNYLDFSQNDLIIAKHNMYLSNDLIKEELAKLGINKKYKIIR